ncbi:ABC transporter ATP-binding protein, partial [uncultured Actinomyces sp.]|uniref:ABC transporter ATP-binding protein n=1 Tax=uncultured Actinomyces sp. TaxID=249061 RepID=UPI0025F69C3C
MSKQTTPSAPPSTSQPVTSQSLLAEPAPTVERAAESHPADSGGPEASAQTGTGGNAQRSREGQAAIARLGAPIRIRLRIGQVLVLLSAVLAVAPYIALVQLGDILLDAYRAGVSPDSQRVHSAVMVLVSAYSARLLLYFMALLITHLADLSLRDRLRRDIVERISHAPLAWFTESTSGRIRKAVQDDTTTVHTVIAHGPVERLNAIVTPLALLICAFWIDWRLALLALSTLILYVLTYSASLRGMNEKTVEMDRKLAAVSSSMVEFVSGIGVVKAFGRVGRAHSAYLTAADEFSSFYRAWAMPLVTVACLSFTWVSIPVLLLVNLGGGALLMHAGTVTLPQVLTTTLIALVLPGALTTVASISWSYQLAGAAALRLCEVLDTPVLPISDSPERPQSARVEIEHVSFSYGDTLAVDDASLILEPGTVTALLGPSGSGKSTLATLIARFADPDAGAVRIGGVDLRDMDEDTLYSTASFILQDAQLLGTTVRENISLGRPDADLEQVRAAARVARIDEEIMALPDGYDTVLGQDTGLSGGQEQRIAIARAILLNTPVILLDEATAMADPESEAEIQQALSALVKDRTVLVIAHRPAAVRGADRIAVMDGGRIVAAGTHDDLADEPHYRALLRQAGELEGATGSNVHETATGKEGPSLADGATDSPDDGVADNAADVRVLATSPSRIDDRDGRTGAARPVPSIPGESSRPVDSLLSRFRRLMTDSSWRQTRGCIALAGVNGVLSGLALLVLGSLLPASVALGAGAPRWGLSFGGWLIVLVVLGLGAAVCDFQGRRMGMSGALGFMHDVHHAVGDRIARLPLR